MDEMIKYLPPVMRKFKEIKELMGVEKKQISDVHARNAYILDNAFISSCNEDGIVKFENMLEIVPDPGSNLELRRAVVALRWNEHVPYTRKVFIEGLNALFGAENYSLYLDEAHYYLFMHLTMEYKERVALAERLIDRMVPRNMYYEIGLYNTHALLQKHTHRQLSKHTYRGLRMEVIKE